MSAIESALIAAVEAIPGFLFPVACAGTMALLDHQRRHGLAGGLVEIGVFQGKYFSVLARSAQAAGEILLGIDTFAHAPPASVHAALAREQDTREAEVVVWAGRSATFRARAIRRAIGGAARFVSVDGSHDKADVARDLRLAAAVLAPHGIIALDDFLNPRALGVGEAAHPFFSRRRALRPFALFGNKLFVAHRAHAPAYGIATERFFAASDLPEAKAYRTLVALGRDQIEQTLWGARLVVV